MSGEEKKLVYSYEALSDSERREVERIRTLYGEAAKGQRKAPAAEAAGEREPTLEDLRALEKRVKRLPDAVSAAVGTVSLLVFGGGLSMVLAWDMILTGSLVAVPGIVGMACTPALSRALLRRGRKRHAAEAERICACLLHEEKR